MRYVRFYNLSNEYLQTLNPLAQMSAWFKNCNLHFLGCLILPIIFPPPLLAIPQLPVSRKTTTLDFPLPRIFWTFHHPAHCTPPLQPSSFLAGRSSTACEAGGEERRGSKRRD